MNERIRELVEQAGMVYWPNKQLDKFAELIVRECIEQCSESLVPHTGQPSMTHNYAVGLCQDKIKEHFGVEE